MVNGNTTGGARRKLRSHGDDSEVGVALRDAYRAAVDEAVPDEMLDLLNKLR